MNVNTYLTPGLVESHTHVLRLVPLSWNVLSRPPHYFLDLKMCQITTLAYNFKFGSDYVSSPRSLNIIREPSKCLKLDLSLNDLHVLNHEGLYPFKECRHLDVSLNRIERFTGIEIMPYLVFINLSHNFISQLDGLDKCKFLEDLNLGMNELTAITSMPPLRSLTTLHLNNNKILSLDGIQALPKLQELYVQKNRLRDIKAVASSFNLMILDASENQISDTHHTFAILRGLRRLTELHLYGNPIEKENHYKESIYHSTTVHILDGLTLKSPYKPIPEIGIEDLGKVDGLKAAAKRAYQQQLHRHHREADENIKFLQRRIISIKEEQTDYEQRLKRDLNACVRYLDHVSTDDNYKIDAKYLKDSVTNPYIPKPWSKEPRHWPRQSEFLNNQQPRRYGRQASVDSALDRDRQHLPLPDGYQPSHLDVRNGRENFRGLKRTDDVLEAAAEVLQKEKYSGTLNNEPVSDI
ncbi:leucine-rich repeat- and IQ domain-containing protein 1-like [Ptychodera flava]|uniref:leucine-rich repeat- and IQ domain-containing protein 1-like n=1 Tax=Ptychodera flava TaxID=63121 RepID=UPI00396A8007